MGYYDGYYQENQTEPFTLTPIENKTAATESLRKSVTMMPLFGNTFSTKKTPPRKSASLSNLHTLDHSTREIELGLEYGPPVMNVGGQSLKFEEGHWISESGDNVSGKDVQRLKKRNLQLEEENNLLKLKIEMLLDMLSETTAECHLMERELEEMKNHRKK